MRCIINSQDIVHETLDGEVVVVNLKNGRYYSLIDTATMIWQEIEAGQDTGRIESHLGAQFQAEPGQIAAGLAQFIKELSEEGLIQIEAGDDVLEDEPPGELSPTRPFLEPVLARHVDMEGLLLLDPIHDVSERGWPEKKAV
jgi:hypothetical protein